MKKQLLFLTIFSGLLFSHLTAQIYTIGATSPAIGTNANYTSSNHYLIFDVLDPNGIVIVSSDIYPNATVNSPFSIVLQNSSSTVIATYTGNTTTNSGPQTVPLNFTIPQGTGYRLGMGTNPGVTRNSAGAVYPYTVPGLMTITGNTFQPTYYYFNYNIKIKSVAVPAPNNAGITAVVDPIAGCVGTHDVNVEVSNLGINQISNVTVNWSVNGAFQGSVPYTQLLDTANGTGPSSDTITLGQVSFVNSGTYKIKAWTVNPNSVPDTVNSDDSTEVTLTGTNYPVATLGADTTICPDQPLNLSASSSGPDSVLWNDTSATFNSRIIANPGFYKVDIYKNGCGTEDSINVTLHPPAPSINLGNDTTFCYGDIITLNATASGVTYSWQDNSSGATFAADTAGDYWVTLEDANSCRSSDSINLKLYKDPSVAIFVSPSAVICYGTSVTFAANGKTAGSEMYQLVINGNNVGAAQSSNVFINPAIESGDTVRVDLLTDQCATSAYPVPSNSIGMTVNPEPILVSGLLADTVIENTKKNYAVSAASGSSYLWRVDGGSIIGDSTTFAVQIQWDGPNPNAKLTVIETTSSNCSRPNELPVNVISIDGIADSQFNYLGSAYPNPADESITIPITSNQSVDVSLGIFDLTGKEILRVFEGELHGNRNVVLSVSDLNNGIYFYKLTTSDGHQNTRKLMIKH